MWRAGAELAISIPPATVNFLLIRKMIRTMTQKRMIRTKPWFLRSITPRSIMLTYPQELRRYVKDDNWGFNFSLIVLGRRFDPHRGIIIDTQQTRSTIYCMISNIYTSKAEFSFYLVQPAKDLCANWEECVQLGGLPVTLVKKLFIQWRRLISSCLMLPSLQSFPPSFLLTIAVHSVCISVAEELFLWWQRLSP